MKKIISFSLWGNSTKYTVGAIENADLALQIYPNWICRFYVGTSTPKEIIEELEKRDNVELVLMAEEGEWNSMFWRFLPIGEDGVEIMLSRDCDSRLSMREKYCVDEFINSNMNFHCMRDHPFHDGIMGGMWGAKKGVLSNINELINNWPKTNQWQTDQSFLNNVVEPLITNTKFLHDSIHLKNFPTKREDYKYVGEAYDINGVRTEHWVVFTFDEFKHLN